MSGDSTASTLSDLSGNYSFDSLAAGGNYVITPSKDPLTAGSSGINTIDLIAIQKHFLQIGGPLTGCPLAAADVNGDSAVSTVDVVATQKFFLGFSSGTANVGKYQFTPVNRSYSPLTNDQTGQNYDTIVFGDVMGTFVHRPEAVLKR